jgi:uncharacterized protein (TIGR03382 family)
MKRLRILLVVLGLVALGDSIANAAGNVLTNGNLDLTSAQEILPGFPLPKPDGWVNVGTRTLSGPYEDELSSEPWAGPAPTPVTADGLLNPPFPEGCGGPDCGVFFKPFTGNLSTGDLATGHLYQHSAGTPGMKYILTGWAGAEAGYSGLVAGGPTKTELALEFLDAGSTIIGGSVLDLAAAGLGSGVGVPFGYKEFMVMAVAPAGTTTVQSRVSMIDGYGTSGGQAFVVDDFTLMCIPEPASMTLGFLGLVGLVGLVRRR